MKTDNLWQTLQRGERYMKCWPLQLKSLSLIFPEHNFIRLIKIALHVMPAFALLLLVWQYALGGDMIIAYSEALFAVSIPFQCFWILGRRAKHPLPMPLVTWYQTIAQQLHKAGYATPHPQGVLTYQDLEHLLQQAAKRLDSSFLQQL